MGGRLYVFGPCLAFFGEFLEVGKKAVYFREAVEGGFREFQIRAIFEETTTVGGGAYPSIGVLRVHNAHLSPPPRYHNPPRSSFFCAKILLF